MARAVSEFQSLLSALADELAARITRLVAAMSELDQPDLLAFITDAAPELLAPFLTAAADLTAIWYDDQDPESDFVATPADLTPGEQLAADARWAMLQPDPVTAWSGSATRALFDASRQTVLDNADREGVKWARHAQPNACGFCRMLAVRGYFYTSEAAAMAVRHADATGHDHCNCTAVPERGTDYTPPPYLQQWKRDYQEARRIAGKKAGAIANAMDYLPGGRRYKGDAAPPREPRRAPVNLDAPKPTPRPRPKPAPPATNTDTDAAVAKRLLPGLQKSLADLRARGLPEDSPQIQYHLSTIDRLQRQLQPR